MEVILNNELIKKNKKQEANQHIYKTNDFDSIQNRLDYFERQLKRVNDELSNYPKNSDKYKECEYRLNKIKKELDFNIDLMNKSIENICK